MFDIININRQLHEVLLINAPKRKLKPEEIIVTIKHK